MKTILTGFLLAISAACFTQEDYVSRIEYLREVAFEEISKPGQLYLVWKDVSATLDNNIVIGIDSTGYDWDILFKRAKIGLVELCHYGIEIRKDTITHIMVSTFEEYYSNQLLDQSKNQFGEPYIYFNEGDSYYEWRRKDWNILPILVIEKSGEKAVLNITGKEQDE
ncbi:MAG: hypothetical protein ABIJ16_08370 [Bacteroidota bacterium]